MKSRLVVWVALGLILLGAAAIRLRLLDTPLDRDEGEYAYFGQLLLQGVPPYAAAYNLKAPGIYVAYAMILAAFGQTTAGVHLGVIVVTSATTVLMFVLARRLAGPAAGLAASGVHAVQALNPKLLGLAGYAEHFVLLFLVAACIALQPEARARRPSMLVTSGFFFALAFLMKQSAAAFVVGGVLFLLLSRSNGETTPWPGRLRATGFFLGGAAAPLVLAGLALWLAGTIRTFVFWSFVYGANYSAPLSAGWSNLVERFMFVVPSSSLTVAVGAIGLGALVRDRRRPQAMFILLLTAVSCIATTVGLHFRPQYCILLLPALALLTATGFDALGRLLVSRSGVLGRAVPVVLVVALLGQPLYASWRVLFKLRPAEASRVIYGDNPFSESREIARYIREHTAPGDRIAVIGSEPQIYFYSGRRSATGYIYTYALMELQPFASAMQQQMIREIESADPRYLVFVRVAGSWLYQENSDQTIFGWFDQYHRTFKRVGVVDILPRRGTVYRWDADAVGYTPRSDMWLMIFERGRTP